MTPKEVIKICRKPKVKVFGKVIVNRDVSLNIEMVKSDVIFNMLHQGFNLDEDCIEADVWNDGNLYLG